MGKDCRGPAVLARAAWCGLLLFALACTEGARLERAADDLAEGDLVGAEARYRAVLDRSPDQADALFGLGWVYHLNGDEDRAQDYFLRLRRVAPNDPRGARGLGSVALAQGRLSEAEALLGQALEASPQDPKILNSLGLVLLSGGRTEEALQRFEQAQALDPARGEYGYNLAESLFRLQRHEQALAEIERALSATLVETRFRGLLLELRARLLVVMTAKRVDPERCAETVPPVLAWLDAADADLDLAQGLGGNLPNLPATRRLVHRRRSVITAECPLGDKALGD